MENSTTPNSVFKTLYAVDMKDKTKEKNGLSYISWAGEWARLKTHYPDAAYTIYENENGRPWFDDTRSGWVKTGVTINGQEHIEYLPIMDLRNKPIPAENITSTDANKAIQRSITKACARHGLGLFIYEGMEDTEENLLLNSLRQECMSVMNKKCVLSDTAKEKVKELCQVADPEANGDPRLITDVNVLADLLRKLRAVRK